MTKLIDHALRYALANELHARPFPTLQAPCRAAFLALKHPEAGGDRARDLAHLTALLDRYGAPHPQPDATHYSGTIGKHHLKWESHTEFVTYTIFGDGVSDQPFDARTFEMFPEDWLATAPGERITSALVRVEPFVSDGYIIEKAGDWFIPESLAISRILDDNAVVAGDFRIDQGGHMRFAVFVQDGVGERRVGRIVQRLCEIEMYKAMSMLGLPMARDLGQKMSRLETDLGTLVDDMQSRVRPAEETLDALLTMSSALENMQADASFRFGATEAYEAIVMQRISVLREERFFGRQTFHEFMTRRYDPAMRTVKSTQKRLTAMAERAIRAGELLRTRVDVERQAQTQKLLESMDRRADLQLRLQKTVEGLSVVAISYYAVNLVIYAAYPWLGIEKPVLGAIATPIVILFVWLLVQRIRKSMH